MSVAKRDMVVPPIRPEFERATLDARNIGEIVRPLSIWERITNITAVRRFTILLLLAALWQAYSVPLDNPLLFPTFTVPGRAADSAQELQREGFRRGLCALTWTRPISA